MKTYIWIAFGLMGWAFYVLSGGSDFTPQIAAVDPPDLEVTSAETVTRNATESLITVTATTDTPSLNVGADPLSASEAALLAVAESPSAVALPALSGQVSDAEAALQAIDESPSVIATATAAPAAITEDLDIREVAGPRVNMRAGPGTNYDVIVTLDGGTALEVLEVDADGWANVASTDGGIQGWIAERLLTSPDV